MLARNPEPTAPSTTEFFPQPVSVLPASVRRTFARLLSLVIILALFSVAPLRHAALQLFRLPLEVASRALRIGWLLPQLPRLTAEHDELRRQLSAAQVELAQAKETLRQTSSAEDLMRSAGLPTPHLTRLAGGPPHAVVASVIGRTLLPTQQSVILNRGAKDGVVVGSLLMSAEGLVGRVIEATPTTSVGLLLTDADSRVACLIERTRETGLLAGTSGSWCQLLYLDSDADLVAGDRVVTAGLGEGFPKGLPVGIVAEVVRGRGGMPRSARVRPAAVLRHLEDVLIIPPA